MSKAQSTPIVPDDDLTHYMRVAGNSTHALREIIKAWDACAPAHRPECRAFSERGCTCGLQTIRNLIHEHRRLVA